MKETSIHLILKNISRFIDLNQNEKDLYISLITEKKFKKKEYLLRQGQIARHDFFISEGCIKIYTLDHKGSEHISMFAVEDWWVGDLASFITQQPANHFVQAIEDSTVLQVSKESFDLLFKQIPKFERFYRMLYQRSLVSFIQRSNQNLKLNAEERYLNFVKNHPGLIQRISQKNLAAYLGVTPEFLSVLRKKIARL